MSVLGTTWSPSETIPLEPYPPLWPYHPQANTPGTIPQGPYPLWKEHGTRQEVTSYFPIPVDRMTDMCKNITFVCGGFDLNPMVGGFLTSSKSYQIPEIQVNIACRMFWHFWWGQRVLFETFKKVISSNWKFYNRCLGEHLDTFNGTGKINIDSICFKMMVQNYCYW